MKILIGAVIVLIIIALVLSGKLRVMIRGFLNLFVEDLAKTPEGASAIYTEAIDKAQNDYNKGNDTLQKIAGRLDSAKNDLQIAKEKRKSIESKCESLAKASQFDKVALFSQQRTEILEEIEVLEKTVKDLTPIFEEAKLVNNALEQKLVKLKKEKKQVVNDITLNTQLKSMYDDMDELKQTTNVDKLLDAVKDGAKDKREKATGARVVHENKLSTKITNAEQDAKKLEGDAYVEELKKKFAQK